MSNCSDATACWDADEEEKTKKLDNLALAEHEVETKAQEFKDRAAEFRAESERL